MLDRIDFGGLVPREELPAVYAAADVMVSPSLAEGHALAPMECLACGTPVVASGISGLRETVEHEANGLLVPPGDPEALADALCRILGDRALLDRLSRASRPSVERFSWAGRVREFEALVARMIKGIDVLTPADVKVAVFNGNGVRLMATTTADYLKARDFSVTKIGNAESFGYDRTYVVVLTDEKKAELLNSALPQEAEIVTPSEFEPHYSALKDLVPDGTDLILVAGKGFTVGGTASNG